MEMEIDALCEIEERNIGKVEKALLNYYKTPKSGVCVSEITPMLKPIFGIRITGQIPFADQENYLNYVQHRLVKLGKLHRQGNLYKAS